MRLQNAVFFLVSTLAWADPQDPVKVTGKIDSLADNKIAMSVSLEIEEKGFRVYKESIKVAAPGREVVSNELPAGATRLDPVTKKEKEVYAESTRWPVSLSPGSGDTSKEIEIAVTYRACNDTICHFPKTKILKLSPKKTPVRADIGYSVSELWSLINSVNGERIKELAASHMWLALLLCFVSGMLTSLTPCVYPMIPITINIFGRAAQAGPSRGAFNPKTFSLAGIYVAGMCVTYSLMGVVAGVTGSLFGKVLQSSFMLGVLTLLFLTLALGQLGLFKLALPASWQTKLSSVGSAENRGGIFLMGLFSGLIVSPCVGPVIAGILAFVFDSSNAMLGFLYFLSFSLGLGVLFLLIGGFSGILSKLPRSGPWMTGVNRTLAALMLVAALYYGNVWAKQVGIFGHGGESAIAWQKDETTALRLAASEGKPLIVDFTAEWCGACHEIEATIFHDPKVVERLSGFVPLRLDVTAETPENLQLLKKYGVMSLPAIVFVGKDGKPLEKPRINGLVPVEAFLVALQSVH